MPDHASPPTFDLSPDLPGEFGQAYDEAAARAHDEHWAERLFDRDTTLWSTDERVQAAIAERLGWLDAVDHFSLQVAALEGFAKGAREAGFTTAVVMGMGGSSLAPDVLVRTFGVGDGWLDLRILDSTDPDNVGRVLDDLDPLATLFIVASKSGTTTEPLAFQAEAWARIEAALRAHDADQSPGTLMVAVTDPGKSLSAIPHHDELREVFLNPPDIGGRYSALSYVGLVPAALIGLDLDAMLANAGAMLFRCRDPEPSRNPGVSLGLAMGTLARAGRDKLTFLADPEIEAFGAWAEQLIAESSGKHGVGVVPVDQEPLGQLAAYGDDRVFVRLALSGSSGGAAADRFAEAAEAGGHPVIRIDLRDPLDLAGEFIRWEVATAIAGVVLGIDPFDQPNVEEAKERTRQLLAGHVEGNGTAAMPASQSLATAGPLALFGDAALRLTGEDGSLVGELRRHLARRKPNAYLAIQAFIAPTPARDDAFARIRTLLRDAYAPGDDGRLWAALPPLDRPAPQGRRADRLVHPAHVRPSARPPDPGLAVHLRPAHRRAGQGDFEAIEAHDLPIVRVHLGPDPDAGIAALEAALAEALSTPSAAG